MFDQIQEFPIKFYFAQNCCKAIFTDIMGSVESFHNK